jgi:hypothetical protein
MRLSRIHPRGDNFMGPSPSRLSRALTGFGRGRRPSFHEVVSTEAENSNEGNTDRADQGIAFFLQRRVVAWFCPLICLCQFSYSVTLV